MASILGVIVGGGVFWIINRGRLTVFIPGLGDIRVKIVFSILVLVAFVTIPFWAGSASSFLEKDTETTNVVEAFERSRGRLLDPMFDNIAEHWDTGIGFGIGSYPQEMLIERDPFFGIPTSASIEKGNMPIAVFEELGVLGFFLVMFWIFVCLRRATAHGLVEIALCMCVIAINFGENIFFSPGGAGLLALLLFTYGSVRKIDIGSSESR
jgi:hypothetical protein